MGFCECLFYAINMKNEGTNTENETGDKGGQITNSVVWNG
jgi:hypothetical protein